MSARAPSLHPCYHVALAALVARSLLIPGWAGAFPSSFGEEESESTTLPSVPSPTFSIHSGAPAGTFPSGTQNPTTLGHLVKVQLQRSTTTPTPHNQKSFQKPQNSREADSSLFSPRENLLCVFTAVPSCASASKLQL